MEEQEKKLEPCIDKVGLAENKLKKAEERVEELIHYLKCHLRIIKASGFTEMANQIQEIIDTPGAWREEMEEARNSEEGLYGE